LDLGTADLWCACQNWLWARHRCARFTCQKNQWPFCTETFSSSVSI